ncbi:hypothetical protein OIU34_23350 [Pararhizobium sp. BT-229]|uniref:hypothetical protein n=1 Tax=Pararhizobium sp. BT-229 TaxID=2986923 RepID=UPI0021F6F7B3|nr:hypothetical protein [Pararhizobium sp. BT-229]MCV9964833.1 hypothetical protein [Pararhizobium sp. BT-229]
MDSVNESRQTVYQRADGAFLINYMSGKRQVTPTADGAYECIQTVQVGVSMQSLTGVIDEVMSPMLRTVLELESGDRWIEIDSDVSARYVGNLTRTAIGLFYHQEGTLEGRHPRRWFALVGKDDAGETVGKVGLCVLPENESTLHPDFVAECHITGHANSNPYPEFAAEIEALADVTELPITPNYQGRPIVDTPPPRRPGM